MIREETLSSSAELVAANFLYDSLSSMAKQEGHKYRKRPHDNDQQFIGIR
jgi:hypothetical protein